jgi:hypothetical protein
MKYIVCGSLALSTWAWLSRGVTIGTKYWEILIFTEFLIAIEVLILFVARKLRFALMLGIIIGIATYLVLGPISVALYLAVAAFIALLIVIMYEPEDIL